MRCAYFDAGRCRSCTWLGLPYDDQLADKQAHVEALLGAGPQWLPPVASPESGYRNKAKMVVTGTAAEPTLGILDPAGARGRPARLPAAHRRASRRRSRCSPASSRTRRAHAVRRPAVARGELKHLLVTRVARRRADGAVRAALAGAGDPDPQAPACAAGRAAGAARWRRSTCSPSTRRCSRATARSLLTEQETLRMRVNGIDLHLRPQSFFQTNTAMAAALYRQAPAWVGEVAPGVACGTSTAGSAGSRCTSPARRGDVVGIEISGEAIASAALSGRGGRADGRALRGRRRDGVRARATTAPDLVVVEPAAARHRRASSAGWLEASRRRPRRLLQLQRRARWPGTWPRCRRCGRCAAQLLDMFPQHRRTTRCSPCSSGSSARPAARGPRRSCRSRRGAGRSASTLFWCASALPSVIASTARVTW